MQVTNNKFRSEAHFLDATEDIETLKDRNSVDLFDQNGYHMTKAEQAFLGYNGYSAFERIHEDCLRQSSCLLSIAEYPLRVRKACSALVR